MKFQNLLKKMCASSLAHISVGKVRVFNLHKNAFPPCGFRITHAWFARGFCPRRGKEPSKICNDVCRAARCLEVAVKTVSITIAKKIRIWIIQIGLNAKRDDSFLAPKKIKVCVRATFFAYSKLCGRRERERESCTLSKAYSGEPLFFMYNKGDFVL